MTMADLWARLDTLDKLALVYALGAGFGAMCRVWMVSRAHHMLRARILCASHAGTAWLCAVAVLLHGVGLLELAGITAVASWLWVSWPTWHRHVPRHFETEPMPLDTATMQGVHGGVRSEPEPQEWRR